MRNFSDGKSDGLALFYVKDGVVYPIAICKEELELLDMMIASMITKASPIMDVPIGKAKMINK